MATSIRSSPSPPPSTAATPTLLSPSSPLLSPSNPSAPPSLPPPISASTHSPSPPNPSTFPHRLKPSLPSASTSSCPFTKLPSPSSPPSTPPLPPSPPTPTLSPSSLKYPEGDEFFPPEYPEVVIHKTQLAKYWLDDTISKPWGDFLQGQILLCYKTDAMLANTVAKQMMELALGLEAAGLDFMWVIRPPIGFDVKGEFKPEWLPKGFEERMKQEGKGLLIHGSAPQISILAHKSTGAFLSHCGWNSTLECLVHGVPIIAWPLSAEQFYNAMLLEKWGASVELARGTSENSHVERDRVREVIEMVMGESEKGKEIRKKAREIRDLMENAWKEGRQWFLG